MFILGLISGARISNYMMLRNGKHLILHDRMKNLSTVLKALDGYIRQKVHDRFLLINEDVCDRYFNESNTPKEIFRVWSGTDTSFDDVTLVTFMSVDKFDVLDMALRQWTGPLSLAIYVNDKSRDKLLEELKKRPNLLKKKHVELSIIPGAFVSLFL